MLEANARLLAHQLRDDFAYGEKVRVNLTGGSYTDTFIALTPGGDRAILIADGPDEIPYTVPLDVVGRQPSRIVIADMMASAVHSELGVYWPGFGSPVARTLLELLDRYVPERDAPINSMLNVLEDYDINDERVDCEGCGYLHGCIEDFQTHAPCMFAALVEAAVE